jgi:hypothetical protein
MRERSPYFTMPALGLPLSSTSSSRASSVGRHFRAHCSWWHILSRVLHVRIVSVGILETTSRRCVYSAVTHYSRGAW